MSLNWFRRTKTEFLTWLRSSITRFFSVKSRDQMANCLDCKSTDSKNSKDMDSEQKYTGDNFQEYIVDERFNDKVKDIKRSDLIVIFKHLSDVITELPNNEEESQFISGVLKRENPFFYKIEYFKDEDLTILVDFNETESDEYLDAILEGRSISNVTREREPDTDGELL